MKKKVLILGGSSDIGVEVVKNFLHLGWKVTAHFFKNKKKLEVLRKNSKDDSKNVEKTEKILLQEDK